MSTIVISQRESLYYLSVGNFMASKELEFINKQPMINSLYIIMV